MTDSGSVVVTGAAGFIGSHLCDALLRAGHRVTGIDDLSSGSPANLAAAREAGPAFTFVRQDIRDGAIAEVIADAAPEVVFHLAAQTAVRLSLRDPAYDAAVNVVGLVRVLEAAAASGARKVVFASSGGTIYGDAETIPIDEASLYRRHPSSPYGITKRAASDYLRYFRTERGLDSTLLALANVYGPRQSPEGEAGVVSIFTRRMLAGATPTIFEDGEQTRDFVHVDDVVAAFLRARDAGSGHLLNIGTGVETSVNRVFDLLAELTGFTGNPLRAPGPGGELRRSALNVSRAEAVLGWTPTVPLREGLASVVAWMRA